MPNVYNHSDPVERTGSVRAAQMLLGHTSSRTTELYLGRGAEAKAEAVRAVDGLLDEVRAHGLGTNVGTTEGSRISGRDPQTADKQETKKE
jgi:hypothetical protein